jgi:ankyrin repeat protein
LFDLQEKKENQLKTKQARKLNTQLLKACQHSEGKSVKELLIQRADPTFVKDIKSGTTPLMYCAKYALLFYYFFLFRCYLLIIIFRSSSSEATLCTTLILQERTTPNAQDSSGSTALYLLRILLFYTI